MIAELAGERANRRHRPGRGWEAVRYRFEIVSDYGGFRDLQRHRMLTCQWQALSPHLGAGVPEEVREAGAGGDYERALETSRAEYERLEAAGMAAAAPYALCLGYRIRYVLDLNAREAMHLIELRSGREGHPTYRAVAQAMHERIADVHPAIAAAMVHVDGSREPRLERIMSEIRPPQRAEPGSRARRRQRLAERPARPHALRLRACMRRVAGRMQTVGAGMLVLAVTVAAPALSAAQQGAGDPSAEPTDPPLTTPAPPAPAGRGGEPRGRLAGRRRGDPAGGRRGR